MQHDVVNNCNLELCLKREKILIYINFNLLKNHVMHGAITMMQM